MSAYANGPKNRVISLAGHGSPVADAGVEGLPQLPFPELAHELEAYFRSARYLEGAFNQEKSDRRRLEEELKALQLKANQLLKDLDVKSQEASQREECIRIKLAESEAKVRNFDKIKAALAQERSCRIQYQKYVVELRKHYSTVSNSIRSQFKNYADERNHLKAQVQLNQRNEKTLQEQVQDLRSQLERAREERKKLDLDLELLNAKISHSKQKEDSLLASCRVTQTHVEQAAQQVKAAQSDLERYKLAWSQMDRQLRKALQDIVGYKKKWAEVSCALAQEKKRCEALDEQMKKEKREKQLALTYLHTAESQLAQMSNAVKEVEQKQPQNFSQQGLELKF